MKNCRSVRFLLPKPARLMAEASDELLEQDSLLFISGESNGSNSAAGKTVRVWRSFYPPRHGLREMITGWEFVEVGCHVSLIASCRSNILTGAGIRRVTSTTSSLLLPRYLRQVFVPSFATG
jgi:hypothetical protein